MILTPCMYVTNPPPYFCGCLRQGLPTSGRTSLDFLPRAMVFAVQGRSPHLDKRGSVLGHLPLFVRVGFVCFREAPAVNTSCEVRTIRAMPTFIPSIGVRWGVAFNVFDGATFPTANVCPSRPGSRDVSLAASTHPAQQQSCSSCFPSPSLPT